MSAVRAVLGSAQRTPLSGVEAEGVGEIFCQQAVSGWDLASFSIRLSCFGLQLLGRANAVWDASSRSKRG